ARRVLLADVRGDGAAALSAVNTFTAKTKADVEESWRKGEEGRWMCTLSYESPLREVHAAGSGVGKKAAKRLAAVALIEDLRAAVPP
ncbi:unnamed protein product, partial [Hapterophycus canaliculatus]